MPKRHGEGEEGPPRRVFRAPSSIHSSGAELLRQPNHDDEQTSCPQNRHPSAKFTSSIRREPSAAGCFIRSIYNEQGVLRVSERLFRLVVIDDHPTTVRGIMMAIADEPRLAVEYSAPTVSQLVQMAPSEIHLAILDLRLPDLSRPAENCATLRERGIDNIVVFTSFDDAYLVREAARSGVLGIVNKAIDDSRLRSTLLTAAQGQPIISTEWAAAVDSDPKLSDVELSPQQISALRLIASGETVVSAARQMGVKPDTVRDYVHRVQLKYSQAGRPTRTRADLYERAIEDGWLPVPRGRLGHPHT